MCWLTERISIFREESILFAMKIERRDVQEAACGTGEEEIVRNRFSDSGRMSC